MWVPRSRASESCNRPVSCSTPRSSWIYGTVSYAAHQVGLSIESLSFLPGYGFAIAAATMVGQSIGAGKYTRAKLENWEANRLATFIMSAMGIVFFFPLRSAPCLHQR